ncbi:hypothetical protein AB1Y20_008180 [Prymnesium parvum]|uniref:peptide-methionine (S)-S-oxide reductase n=1 Tax=Prymnesium parvum TaxID=97485 RepID=A0AB34IW52_PRYPA
MGGRWLQPPAAERPIGERTSRRQAGVTGQHDERAELLLRIEELEEAALAYYEREMSEREGKEELERLYVELQARRKSERKRADELALEKKKLEIVIAELIEKKAEFDRLPGVVSSSVGYTGGKSDNPTYNSVCRGDGHTEAVRVEFDPEQMSYEELISRVLRQGRGGAGKAQYKSAVWAQDEKQKEKTHLLQLQGLACAVSSLPIRMLFPQSNVPVLPAAKWHDAEDYHQKYIEKQGRW